MKPKEREFLLKMIGTQGLLELSAICELLPKNHRWRNPFLLACHLLNVGIDDCKATVNQKLGIKTESEE